MKERIARNCKIDRAKKCTTAWQALGSLLQGSKPEAREALETIDRPLSNDPLLLRQLLKRFPGPQGSPNAEQMNKKHP